MIEIIRASKENLDKLTELGMELWPNNEYSNLEDDFVYIIGHLNNRVYLAKSGDDYIGFIHIAIRKGFVEGANTNPVGYVEGVYVRPEFRKMGVAKILYYTGLEWIKSRKCSQIGADLGLDNNVCPDYFVNMGFEEVNRIICYINNI